MEGRMKPKVEIQGKAIVEPDENSGYLVMFPDGDIMRAKNPSIALARIKRWFKQNMKGKKAIGVGKIEWRNCRPPEHN